MLLLFSPNIPGKTFGALMHDQNGTVYKSDGTVLALSGGGSSSTTLSSLTDIVTYNLAANNTSISTALGSKVSIANVYPVGSSDWIRTLAYSLDNFSISGANYDEYGILIHANLTWPDGTPGQISVTGRDLTLLAVVSYTITYSPIGGTTVTATQPAITRDSYYGTIVTRPAITIA
jgi:hypothetical protein